MKYRSFIFIIFTLAAVVSRASDETMEKSLADVSEQIVGQVNSHAKKKVAVIDFTDLKGNSSELGRYVAEEITINLVTAKRDFAVLDRANLKSILAEHKLTSQGLVDPENAKKLGQFAGVDAIILGSIVPLDPNIELTAKVITTDTAEIVGAARTHFKADDTIKQLQAHPTEGSTDSEGPKPEEPHVVKSCGDLRIMMPPLRIVNGNEYILTMILTNASSRTLWAAVSTDMGSNVRGALTTADANQCGSNWNLINGLAFAALQNGGIFRGTEVPAHDSITVTMTFGSHHPAIEGLAHLQLELLVSRDFNGTFGEAIEHTLLVDLRAR